MKFRFNLQKCYSDSYWQFLLKLLLHATTSAYKKFRREQAKRSVISDWRDLKNLLAKVSDNFDQMLNKLSSSSSRAS